MKMLSHTKHSAKPKKIWIIPLTKYFFDWVLAQVKIGVGFGFGVKTGFRLELGLGFGLRLEFRFGL